MSIKTLAIKVQTRNHIKVVEEFLKAKLKGLRVKTQILGTNQNGWVQTSISGEDEDVALRYINEEIGTCPENIESIKKFDTLKGYITALNKIEILLDVGIDSQLNVKAVISLSHLQAQLADGRKVALKKVGDLYGFCENLPLIVKAYSIAREEAKIEVILSENQLKRYKRWTESLLERLIVLGATREEIMHSLKTIKCTRDIIDIESLGLFENAVTCKLGTNAAGLIPKIGKKLPNAKLTVFSPAEILEFLR
ncbi:MAG: DUF2110 family protein [Candidatus Bathyarchaeia archaeon]